MKKIEDDVIQKQVDKLMETKKAVDAASLPVEPSKAEISFDDFGKMDIGSESPGRRAGRKIQKLLKLKGR